MSEIIAENKEENKEKETEIKITNCLNWLVRNRNEIANAYKFLKEDKYNISTDRNYDLDLIHQEQETIDDILTLINELPEYKQKSYRKLLKDVKL